MSNEPPFITCRKCGGPIREQYRFGSPQTGWEHMPGECIEPPSNSADIERAEDMAEEWRWGYIHGYLHGWSDKTAGRQYGESRNLRKPEVGRD